jgi:hypothetical protein
LTHIELAHVHVHALGNCQRETLELDLAEGMIQDAAEFDALRPAHEVDGNRDLDLLVEVDQIEIGVKGAATHGIALKLLHQHRPRRAVHAELDQGIHAGTATLKHPLQSTGIDGDRLRLHSLAVHHRRDTSSGSELSRDTLSGRVADLRNEGVHCHGVLSSI